MKCKPCRGEGVTGFFEVCDACNGSGKIPRAQVELPIGQPGPSGLASYVMPAEPTPAEKPKTSRSRGPLPPLELPHVPQVNSLQEALALLGYEDFRPGQREIVDSILTNRATLAICATGFGKSLCFQITALMLEGLTVVVSPLIALMRDQVASLTAKGIPAAALTSQLTPRQQRQVLDAIPRLKLLYVAPERLNNEDFVEAMKGEHISQLVCDEAHQISEAGLSYRPAYRLVGYLMRQYRPDRISAFTASATEEVAEDIRHQLLMRDAETFVMGFDRPNLTYMVRRLSGMRDDLVARKNHEIYREILSARQREPGCGILVYTMTTQRAEDLAAYLRRCNLTEPRAYHAKLKKAEREETERDFLERRSGIVVATCAFGMGVDRPDVRLVIHDMLPGSVEAYYQEAGRAGRDGRPARCVLLFGGRSDVGSRQWLIEQTTRNPETTDRQKRLLFGLVRQLDNPDRRCRAAMIRSYFGERTGSRCGRCDGCGGT